MKTYDIIIKSEFGSTVYAHGVERSEVKSVRRDAERESYIEGDDIRVIVRVSR